MNIINKLINWFVMQWHLLGLCCYQIWTFFRSEDDYRVLVLKGSGGPIVIHALASQRLSQQLNVPEIVSTNVNENTVVVGIEGNQLHYFECRNKTQAQKLEREIVIHVFRHLFG